MSLLLIAVAAALALALAGGQWFFHRSLQRKALDGLKSRHLQQHLAVTKKLDQAKRQIAQLQQELAASRLELKQRLERAGPPPVPTREELNRELDGAASRPRRPIDGFADTLPSLQFAHADELLLR